MARDTKIRVKDAERRAYATARLIELWGSSSRRLFGRETYSRSGMSRRVECWLVIGGDLVRVDFHIAAAWGYGISKTGGIKMGGCGFSGLSTAADCLGQSVGASGPDRVRFTNI
jgi:hypothetical protein